MVKNGPKWQKIVCHTPYLRKHNHMTVIFATHVKLWHLQQFFSIFFNFDFCQKLTQLTHNYQFHSVTLYLRNCRSQVFVFFKKYNINIKITFFIGPLQQFFKQMFFKFVNKCQAEILRCDPPSHKCDFFT